MAGIKKFPLTGNKDNQIFEYSDTLSLEIDDAQKHLKAGDAVVATRRLVLLASWCRMSPQLKRRQITRLLLRL